MANNQMQPDERLFVPIPYIPKTIEIKSLLDKIDNKFITVGRTLSNFVDAKSKKNNVTIKNQDYLKCQRDYTWNNKMASNLICSIIQQRNIGEILLYRHDDTSVYLKTIDGQQRMTTIWKFVENLFSLNLHGAIFDKFVVGKKEIPRDKLQGKYFKDLPLDWQESILSYSLRVIVYNNCTDEQARQIYIDIATGTKPLRAIEVRRALMNESLMHLIYDFVNAPWAFHTMTTSAILGSHGIDIVSQLLTLIMNNNHVRLDKDNINKCVFDLNDNGISESLTKDMSTLRDYLNKVFDIWIENKKKEIKQETIANPKGRHIKNFIAYRFKFLSNKTYLVMFLWSAYMAIKMTIPIEKYQVWAYNFFQKPNAMFLKGMASGKSKVGDIENVDMRVTAITEELKALK